MRQDDDPDREHEPPTAVEPWEIEDVQVRLETPLFRVRAVRATSRTAPHRSGEFVTLESPDWVNVIALTGDGDVVLIEQYRHGVEEVTLEIPGGTVDPGEEPLEAGLRELLEETGYGGGEAELIGSVTPNPAILDNRCATVLVRGARWLQDPVPEGNEEIAVHLRPLAEVPGLIRRGVIHHALVVAAFHHLQLVDESGKMIG